MFLGAIVAGILSVVVLIASRWLSSSIRDRISLSFLFGGATCLIASGFMVDPALGYFAAGILAVGFALLVGYEGGE